MISTDYHLQTHIKEPVYKQKTERNVFLQRILDAVDDNHNILHISEDVTTSLTSPDEK
jgi:spore coat polysaccharide biosynthesis protein SpsF (cytidylyltransferase family)